MKLTREQVMSVLDQEISWHRADLAERNDESGRKQGFIAGLEQAKYVLGKCFEAELSDMRKGSL